MALEDAKTQVDAALIRDGYRGLAYENSFGGALSFLRRTYSKDLNGVELAVTGGPFDHAVSNRLGTRLGPRAIREASTLQTNDPPYGWGFDPLSAFAIADYGDLAFDYADSRAFPAALTAHIKGILDAGAASLVFGGDYNISFSILRAYAEKYGPMSLLQFDAQSDTWPDDDMERIDHGMMFYKAVKQGLIDPKRFVLVGIRTVNSDNFGVSTIDAREVHVASPEAAARKIKTILGDHPTYLSFDIDALDSGAAPGTATPVWGGSSSGQVAILLRDISGINGVGGDVVDVSPPYDPSGATAVAGAHVAMEILCLWGWNKRGGLA